MTRRCWATRVSPCRGKLSKEHIFSRGLSTVQKVFGSGLPHLGAGRLTSIDDFQVRSLCQRHNSELSDLDQAAIDLKNVALELDAIARERRPEFGNSSTRIAVKLDGTRFERWALKTTINTSLAMAHDWRWTPPPNFGELVFGGSAIPAGCGLAFLAQVSGATDSANGAGCTWYRHSSESGISASIIGFAGFLFLCSWSTPIKRLLPLRSRHLNAEMAILHREAVEIPGTNVWFEFDWTGAYRNDSDPSVTKLRSRYQGPSR